MDEEIKRHVKRLEVLKRIRKSHEQRMIDAIKYVLPYHHDMDPKNQSEEWEDERYDTTATEAASMLADGLMGNLSPPSVKWFSFRATKNELNDIPQVREWLQEVDERVVEALDRSNFYDLAPVIYRHAVSVETVAVMADRDPQEEACVFSIIPPKEIFVVNDPFGKVEAVYRNYYLSAEQAKNAFGDVAFSLPLQRALQNDPDTTFPFVTVVYRDRLDNAFPWKAVTFEETGQEILVRSKFRSNPIPVWRWEVRGRDAYGYGLTTDAMATIKVLNEMQKTLLGLAQRIAAPPLFVPESMADEAEVSFESGAINYYKDPGQRPFTLELGSGYPVTSDLIAKVQEQIREKYKTKYFLMLMQMETSGRTAFEIRERKIEKITAMGSIVGRCQQEFLGPVLSRVFWMEYEAGNIPEPPEEMGSLMVEYVGPFAQAQKEVMQTSGVLTGLQNASVIFQMDPRTTRKIKFEEALDQILVASGFPAKAIVPNDEYLEMLAQEAAQAQAQAQAAGHISPAGNPPIANEILRTIGG